MSGINSVIAIPFLFAKRGFYHALFKKIKASLVVRILINPSCWIRNYRTDKEWDSLLNTLLDYGEIDLTRQKHGLFWCSINNHCVWIKNFPNAFGNLYNPDGYPRKLSGLPSRKTAFRLHDIIEDIQIKKWERKKMMAKTRKLMQ